MILVVAYGTSEQHQFVKRLRDISPTQEVVAITDVVSLCEALALSRPTGILLGTAVRWIATHRLLNLVHALRPEVHIVLCRPVEDHLDVPSVFCFTEMARAVAQFSTPRLSAAWTQVSDHVLELPVAVREPTVPVALAPGIPHGISLVTSRESARQLAQDVQGAIIIASEHRALVDLIVTYVHRLDCNIRIQTVHHMTHLENLELFPSQPTMLLCSDKLPGADRVRLAALFEGHAFHRKILWGGKRPKTEEITDLFDHTRSRPIQGVNLAEDVQMWLA